MKTTEQQRQEIRGAIAECESGMPLLINGTPIMLEQLLDDVDELLNANARLAPKAKEHDRILQRADPKAPEGYEVRFPTFELWHVGVPVVDPGRALMRKLFEAGVEKADLLLGTVTERRQGPHVFRAKNTRFQNREAAFDGAEAAVRWLVAEEAMVMP